MAFPKYIAWLNGTSVAVGSQSEVEQKARDIFASKLWQDTHQGKETTLKITTYGKQLFTKSIVLSK